MNKDNLRLIGSSKDYLFFYDDLKDHSYIINRKDVRLIEQEYDPDEFYKFCKAFNPKLILH